MTASSPTDPWAMSDDQLKAIVEEDRLRAARARRWLVASALAGCAGLTAVALFRTPSAAQSQPMFVCAAFLLVVAVAAPLAVMAAHRARRRRWSQRQRECKELGAIVSAIRNRTLAGLISFNFRLMDRFVAVALS